MRRGGGQRVAGATAKDHLSECRQPPPPRRLTRPRPPTRALGLPPTLRPLMRSTLRPRGVTICTASRTGLLVGQGRRKTTGGAGAGTESSRGRGSTSRGSPCFSTASSLSPQARSTATWKSCTRPSRPFSRSVREWQWSTTTATGTRGASSPRRTRRTRTASAWTRAHSSLPRSQTATLTSWMGRTGPRARGGCCGPTRGSDSGWPRAA
mmetsp:Transcript_20117/g.46349  ORF Transcript_20117/g.46349 Transcript_20117/m.46349 type:complete len:209 (-) Transcript_20117:545-1171(-)